MTTSTPKAGGLDPETPVSVLRRFAITTLEQSLGRPPTEAEASRATAAARDRGLPSVCWALLNSTEFVYVR